MGNTCEEIEDLDKRDKKRMYSLLKEVTGIKSCYKNNIAIKNSDSTVAMELEDVKARWKEYIEELFHDDDIPLNL